MIVEALIIFVQIPGVALVFVLAFLAGVTVLIAEVK